MQPVGQKPEPSETETPGAPTYVFVVLGLMLLACGIFGVYTVNTVINTTGEVNEWVGGIERAAQQPETLAEFGGDSARDEAVRLRGFNVPTSAVDLRLARQGTLNPVYWLRFELTPDTRAAFIADTCLDESVREPVTFVYATDPDIVANLAWWSPDVESAVVAGQCDLGASATLTLVVNDVTVYAEIVAQ